jgi:hypothetical protein
MHLIVSWNVFLDTEKKNVITLELKKLSTTYFTEDSTEQATIDVDMEPLPADSSYKNSFASRLMLRTRNWKMTSNPFITKLLHYVAPKTQGGANHIAVPPRKKKKPVPEGSNSKCPNPLDDQYC